MRCISAKLVKASRAYVSVEKEVEKPSVSFLVSAIKACGILKELEIGRLANSTALQTGLISDVFVANSLITMYARCRCLLEARLIFERMPLHSVASWNSMIAGCTENGEPRAGLDLFSCMLLQDGSQPDSRTFVAAAVACSSFAGRHEETAEVDGEFQKTRSLEMAMVIHAEVMKHGCFENNFVENALIDMFGKCGSVTEAGRIFEKMVNRDVVSWTAMMLGCVDNGESETALELFSRMMAGYCAPNSRTYVAAVKACSSLVARGGDKVKVLGAGREIHLLAEKNGCDTDLYVGSSLVDMYGKCGSLEDVNLVFNRMLRRDVVVWNSLLLSYVENGECELALKKFKLMQEQGECSPDSLTFVAALMACSSLAAEEKVDKRRWLKTGMELHAVVIEAGFSGEISVGNTLVDMYSKCGCVVKARDVFEGLRQRSSVTWNALLLGYVEANEYEAALELFARMTCTPNARTYVPVLMACGKLSTALETGRRIHAEICARGLESDEFVANSLVDFYSRSGSPVNAQIVFDSINRRTLVMWSSLVTGFGHHGEAGKVLEMFQMILEDGLTPDGIVFSSVLAACSHAGRVRAGKQVFDKMVTKYGVTPDIGHYHCVIDLLGRNNRVQEALQLVHSMPFRPTEMTWNTLLAAGQKWNNAGLEKLAVEALEKMHEINF